MVRSRNGRAERVGGAVGFDGLLGGTARCWSRVGSAVAARTSWARKYLRWPPTTSPSTASSRTACSSSRSPRARSSTRRTPRWRPARRPPRAASREAAEVLGGLQTQVGAAAQVRAGAGAPKRRPPCRRRPRAGIARRRLLRKRTVDGCLAAADIFGRRRSARPRRARRGHAAVQGGRRAQLRDAPAQPRQHPAPRGHARHAGEQAVLGRARRARACESGQGPRRARKHRRRQRRDGRVHVPGVGEGDRADRAHRRRLRVQAIGRGAHRRPRAPRRRDSHCYLGGFYNVAPWPLRTEEGARRDARRRCARAALAPQPVLRLRRRAPARQRRRRRRRVRARARRAARHRGGLLRVHGRADRGRVGKGEA